MFRCPSMSPKERWKASVLAAMFVLCSLIEGGAALPDQGRWQLTFTQKNNRVRIPKSMFKDSQVFIEAVCNPLDNGVDIAIQLSLARSICWKDFYHQCDGSYSEYSETPITPWETGADNHTRGPVMYRTIPARCTHGEHIVIPPLKTDKPLSVPSLNNMGDGNSPPRPESGVDQPVFVITSDGIYLLTVEIISVGDSKPFNVSVTIKMRGTYGYLSAVDWPFLPFYATMCGVYVCLGTGWLVVCWLQWRDILRIQFWIGAVVLLGMLEKATFYAEYSSLNSSGVSVRGAVLAAEWVSVAKRALARMLVIIVSLGFGIVKPRLGPMLQRVVGLGVLWGALAALEAWLRIGGRVPIDGSNNDNASRGGDGLLAAAPLALLDAALCWWVFSSLLNTTRTLRLRRNTVKLSLYKHFTNTLIFAVVSSIIFMLYSIKAHCLAECLKKWKELWIDEAYWHILFSTVLLVIMILWRPTNNNQRYAFTPLLDNPDDDDDEEEHFVSDAYGVKIRGFTRSNSNGSGSSPLLSNAASSSNTAPLTAAQREEADLKWVEDNIPAAALPILDSDEEILNAKFEVSKMQ